MSRRLSLSTPISRGTDRRNRRSLDSLPRAIVAPLATHQIRHLGSCSALFARLGANGLETLANSEYLAATAAPTGSRCEMGVAAYGWVGSPRTVLCPVFASFSTARAAKVLIHEALHFAGLGEKPSDPNGPFPYEINQIVGASCQL